MKRKKQGMPAVHCVIFGSDVSYINIASMTGVECHKFSIVNKVHQYSPASIPDALVKYGERYKRGFGYWIWKPWIVENTLKQLNDNDILIYIDGRCNIGAAFENKIKKFISQKELDMIVWMIDSCSERNWSTGDIFHELDVPKQSFAATSDQIAATFFVLRKNKNVRNFVEDWHKFCVNHMPKLRDEKSKIINHRNFIENRHDQSAFSLILKEKYIFKNKLNVGILKSEDLVFENFIIPHGKLAPHEAKFSWAVKYIPKFLRPLCGRIINKIHFRG